MFLRCNYEQAIVLASYSLQAESGDHDPERHTLENLQDLPLLPKTMMAQLSEERFGKTFNPTVNQIYLSFIHISLNNAYLLQLHLLML